MGISGEVALAAARTYTKKSLAGMGALKGDPCEIQSITPIEGGNRVTFEWTDGEGNTQTSTMDVMNGESGVYNVLDYGLVNDGETDNTEALQDMIDNIPEESVVYFPQGRYVISDTIEIDKALSFIGDTTNVGGFNFDTDRVPESMIIYSGDAANKTMFVRTIWREVSFKGLTFRSDSFRVSFNSNRPDTYPRPMYLDVVTKEGISAIDMHSPDAFVSITNCRFFGFSGFAVRVGQHKYVQDCSFFNCYDAIQAGCDSIIQNCWICRCHNGIKSALTEAQERGTQSLFASVMGSDIWADQMSGHFYLSEIDGIATCLFDNLCIDLIDESAFCSTHFFQSGRIDGYINRYGMACEGIEYDNITEELLPKSCCFYSRGLNTKAELNIITNPLGDGRKLIACIQGYGLIRGVNISCENLMLSDVFGKHCNVVGSTDITARVYVTSREGTSYRYREFWYTDGVTEYLYGPLHNMFAPTAGVYCKKTNDNTWWMSTAPDDREAWIKVSDIVTKLDYVTPQMYGAKADGVTDDTEAVLAALNSGNPMVYFPAGEYLVQWLNSITLTDRELFISGAGKYESIIHFADGRESNADGYGYKFATGTSGTSSIFIRDIGLYHDNQDTEVTYTEVNYNMLTFNGQFKTIDVDNVYFHTGYNRTTNCATPYNTCIWGKAGADEIRVTNSVFENYDNRQKGGGLWWSPSDWSRIFTCGHVEFSGNTFRHTNNDEAIAFWALGDENDPNVFRDNEFNMREVKMLNNLIIHDNFNGECYRTDYLINFAARKWNTNLAANYFFSGNKIILEKSRLGVIRVENLDEVVISDNDIYVGSIVAQANPNTWHVIAPIGGRVVFKHNMFNCQAPANTDRVNIVTYKSTLEVIQNVFRSSFWFVLASWNPGNDYENPDKDFQGTCINFVGNVVENKSIGVDAGNNTKFNIIDNKVNGTVTFVGQSSGSPINIRGNTFRYRYGDIADRDLRGRDVKYIENHGVKLTVDSAQITSAMDNFVYVGRKEDLVFKVNGSIVEDSPTVRARFFTACDIVYYDDPDVISIDELQTVVAASADFADFQTRIAAL